MTDGEQLDLADYVQDVHDERRRAERKQRRGEPRAYIVFATDPARAGEADYKLVFACNAHTRAVAEAKVREKVDDSRRVTAYLASGKYKDQLPDARWIT